MYSLLLLDQQDITREGMKAVALRTLETTEIHVADNLNALSGQLVEQPDAVVVLDYTLLNISADDLLILQQRFRTARFILFSESLSEPFIRRMIFSSPAFSVIMKDAPLTEIEEGLRSAVRNRQYLCSHTQWMLQRTEEKRQKETSAPALTATEREILKLLAQGKTSKEIAALRFLSVYTVMTHRKNIFRKLEVNNVREATRYALRAGIIDAVEYYI